MIMPTATAEHPAPPEGLTPEQQAAWVASLTATEVQVGSPNGPGLWIAPAGTALPIDCKTAFTTPWSILGYIAEEGPTIGQNFTNQDLYPWQSTSPVRSVVTQKDVTLHFILWQVNAQSMSLYFDADPPTPSITDGSFTMPVRADKGGHIYALGVDALDGTKVLRVGFTRATLTAAGNMPIARGATVPMECTLTAQVDQGVLATVMAGPSQ